MGPNLNLTFDCSALEDCLYRGSEAISLSAIAPPQLPLK